MSSDEEDYMSDAFLQKCADIRPGLGTNQARKKYEKEKQEKEANMKNAVVPKKKLEADQREMGLKTSISSESKGFALLQKMGYKPGMGIGKEGKGRVEPVPIEVRSGRSGLGRDTELKRKATEMNTMRAQMTFKRQKAEERRKEMFVGRMSEKFSGRNTERDLKTAQKACLQLDQRQGLSEPAEPFFWPSSSLPKSGMEGKEEDEEEEVSGLKGYVSRILEDRNDDSDLEDDDDDVIETPAYLEFSELERLDILTRYLRNTYFYCIWCGTKYNDRKDLQSNCPGNTSDAHD